MRQETNFAGLERKRRRSIADIDRGEEQERKCPNRVHKTLGESDRC